MSDLTPYSLSITLVSAGGVPVDASFAQFYKGDPGDLSPAGQAAASAAVSAAGAASTSANSANTSATSAAASATSAGTSAQNAASSASSAAASAGQAANAAAYELQTWGNAEAFDEFTVLTEDANGVTLTANIKWPDGTSGVFTTDAVDATYPVINAWHATYLGAVTRTVTQPTVTRRPSDGKVTYKPRVTLS